MSLPQLMIHNLSAQKLVALSQQILVATSELVGIDGSVDLILQVINADCAALEALVHRNPANSVTAKLMQMDEERDSLYMALRHYLNAWAFRVDDKEKHNAAHRVLQLFKEHGVAFLDAGFARESAELEVLLKKLEEPEMLQALEQCGAGDWFEALRASQDRFNAAYVKETSQLREDVPAIREVKAQLVGSIAALFNYLEFRSRTNSIPHRKTILSLSDLLK